MSKIIWNGGTLLAPVPPVLVTCGTLEKANVCTVAWCGTLNTKPPKTYISLRPSRYSHEIISQTQQFVINLPTANLVKTIDYCGVKSGRLVDKIKECGLTLQPSSKIAAPILQQAPLALECKVFNTIALGSHDMFMADIVAVHVEENLIDTAGRLHLNKANLATYAHGEYFELGQKIGSFGFSVRKKKKKKKFKK